MMHPNTIASLIDIRAFLERAVDNLHIKLTRDDIKNVQTKVAAIDKVIIEQALKLDFSVIDESKHIVKEYDFTNSEDIMKDVLQDIDQEANESSEPAKSRRVRKTP